MRRGLQRTVCTTKVEEEQTLLPKLPQAFPEVPDQEILEEEEVPLLDSPNRDGPKRSDGDGNPQTQRTATTDPQTNILQNLERANQSILELGNMVQQQQMQLAQLQQLASVAQHQRGVCINTAEVDEQRPVVQPQPSLIDTRTLGKPETFQGDANESSDWQFIFKSHMSCVNPLFAELLETTGGSRIQ